VVATDGVLPVQSSSFFELKVHGMDAGAFYGVHLPERVQNADIEVLQLRAKVEELEAQAQSHLSHREAASLEAAEELRRTREAHLAEIERLRDSRNEVLSSISVLGSLVDDVRREGGHDRLAQERRLESLQNALDQNRALVAEAASSQSIDNGQFKAQLAELRQQLIQAVATEERVRSSSACFPSPRRWCWGISMPTAACAKKCPLCVRKSTGPWPNGMRQGSPQQLQLAVTAARHQRAPRTGCGTA
jgi:hypothetical protein